MGGAGDDVVLALLALSGQGVAGCARQAVRSAPAVTASSEGLVGGSLAAACLTCQHETMTGGASGTEM